MKTKVPKALYLVPVLYAGIIAVFIYLQFSGVDTFTSTVSHLTAMGQISKNPLGGDDNISDLQIFGTGILFPLDNKNPIRIYSTDGLVHKAEPSRYRNTGSRLEIEMTSGLTLVLTPDEENSQSVAMSIDFNDFSSIKSVSIPFNLARDFNIDSTGGLPIFSVNDQRSGEVTMLTLPMGAILDEENGRISLPCGVSGIEAVLVEKTEEIRDPLSFWFSKKADLLTEEEYSLFLDDYLSRAMEGFRNSRFDQNKGVWLMPEGEERFSEEIAAILLSTAMAEGQFRSQLERMEAAAARNPGTLSINTLPYLGDIIKVSQAEMRNETALIQNLERMINSEDPEIFINHNLYSTIYRHMAEDRREELSILATLADRSNMSTRALSGLLKYYLDRIENGETDQELTAEVDQIITTDLLPRLRVLQEGFFLVSKEEQSPLLLSLTTGTYFQTAGELLERNILGVLGMELVYSSLKMSDILGIIPSLLTFDNGQIHSSGAVPPEEIYPLIASGPYTPREYSASPEGTPGSWIFTAAENVEVTRNGSEVKYSFDYQPGIIHYVLIQGVAPFKRMSMLGLNWKPDPVFYRYYSGWYYDPKSQSLFIKIRNKTEKEEIVLYY